MRLKLKNKGDRPVDLNFQPYEVVSYVVYVQLLICILALSKNIQVWNTTN